MGTPKGGNKRDSKGEENKTSGIQKGKDIQKGMMQKEKAK